MFPHNTEYDHLDKEALLQKSEELFHLVHSEHERFQIKSQEYEERIDATLKSLTADSMDSFVSILSEKDFVWCCEYSQDFSMLSVMQSIIPLEVQNNLSCSIFSMKSLKDTVECYTQIAFMMRRMEFDFPMEEQLEIIPIIEKYQLTPIYLYLVLKTGLFDQKMKIAKQLSNIYTCMEQPKWASLFTKFE